MVWGQRDQKMVYRDDERYAQWAEAGVSWFLTGPGPFNLSTTRCASTSQAVLLADTAHPTSGIDPPWRSGASSNPGAIRTGRSATERRNVALFGEILDPRVPNQW